MISSQADLKKEYSAHGLLQQLYHLDCLNSCFKTSKSNP